MLQHNHIFFCLLYMPHKMLFFHENLCTNIEYHNVYQKNYVRIFLHFQNYFLIILYNGSKCFY
jgi:hypothetical protein